MLRKVRPWHHVVVGLVIALMTLLAGCPGDRCRRRCAASDRERFDAKQVTVWPEGDNGVHVREIVDIDFGSTERHGYQRIIPNDFGDPQSVDGRSTEAERRRCTSSTSATTPGSGSATRTSAYTGRHRYELDYVLPDARR